MQQTSKKVLKWIGLVLGSLFSLLLLALVGVYILSTLRMNKQYSVQAMALPVAVDATASAEGQRQFMTRGCVDCHGANGAGKPVIEDALVGYITASNLTPGAGGIGGHYTDADWERAIRHGVTPAGKPLIIMPSHEYNAINDADLSTLIAYLKTLAPVATAEHARQVGPLGRILLVGGVFPILPAEVIDHDAPRPQPVVKGATVEYGRYLAQTCGGCHGLGFSGGPVPGVPASPPYPRNLTPDVETGLGSWQEADFFRAIREGLRPDGTQLSPAMPWPAFKLMTDEEIRALWLYLQTVPAKPYGNR